MEPIKNIINNKAKAADYRNKHEFQAYANRLAEELGDIRHRSLYMRLVKENTRARIEAARLFALGYEQEPNKGRLFMWKLKQLKEKSTEQNDENSENEKNKVEQNN